MKYIEHKMSQHMTKWLSRRYILLATDMTKSAVYHRITIQTDIIFTFQKVRQS